MSFISAFFYDRCMKEAETACLSDWRRDLLKNVRGDVLEIGAGTGASIDLYPRNSEIAITLSEPDRNMRLQLERKIETSERTNIQSRAFSSENIDARDNTFDVVFVSLVCCSVTNVSASLAEIKRVLKPEGKFVFLEHVAAAPGSHRRKWQDRLNFLWRKIAGNCHLNRETESLMREAGFDIETIKHESMRKAMSLVRPTIRGVAVLPKS